MKKLKVFEAFAGVGSQSMALRNIGVNYEIVGTMDVDKWAILSYDAIHNNNELVDSKTKEEILKEIEDKNILYNFSTGRSEIPKNEDEIRRVYEAHIRNKNYGDIRKINCSLLPDFDFFTYSFPCKNISNAGQQAGFEKESGTQSSLVWECERIISYKKPKYLMMENVKNIVGKNNKETFDLWCETLVNLGYNNYWKVLNGKQYGVAQNRERTIMISILKEFDDGNFYLPEGNNITTYLKDVLEVNVDEAYYINESKNEGFITKEYIENECIFRVREATKKGFAIGKIGDSINLEHPNSKTRRGRVGKGVCNTLTTSCNYGVIDFNGRIRKLTELECWRLQGFSDEDFFKAKNVGLPISKLYERAGRGIVVPMLEEIFKVLFKEYINVEKL